MSAETRTPGHPGYQLCYTFEPPTQDQREEFGTWVIEQRRDATSAEGGRLAAIGNLQLVRSPLPMAEGENRVPVLGRRGGGAPVGIDTAIWSQRAGHVADLRSPPSPTSLAAVSDARRDDDIRPSRVVELAAVLDRIGVLEAVRAVAHCHTRIVLAVIDTQFEALDANRDGRIGAVEVVGLPRRARSGAGVHGDVMVDVIVKTLADTPFYVRRLRIPDDQTSGAMAPSDIAIAVGTAVDPHANGSAEPAADIVLIAMSSGQWGTPPHLDAFIEEAARSGRGGRGAVIVCSAGRPDHNKQPSPRTEWLSAALGADELGSHPDVLLVAPCNLEGKWLRRHETATRAPAHVLTANVIAGRMGPAVQIAAPGIYTTLGDRRGAVDESSMASALLAGVSSLVLLAQPDLTAYEVKLLFRQTAFVPHCIDASQGPESRAFQEFDREGHNFKIGAGMVNPLGAVLAARDPICQALLRISVPRPPEIGALFDNPGMLLSRWFDRWIREHRDNGGVIEGYLRFRGALTRYFMQSVRSRDELHWIMRHLVAIFTHDGSHVWFTPVGETSIDHGALRRRIRRLLCAVARDATQWAPDASPDASRWISSVIAELDGVSDLRLEHLISAAFLGMGPASDL